MSVYEYIVGRLGGYGGDCTVSHRWFVLEGAILKSKPGPWEGKWRLAASVESYSVPS